MIAVRLLGPTEARGHDGRVLDELLRQPKRFALLAYLAAARPCGFHRRDTLIGLFWAESTQKQARQALSQALHVLRSQLGDGAIITRGDGEICLDAAVVSVDVIDFQRFIGADELEAAMELYRGDLLQGFYVSGAPEFERWMEREREALRGEAVRAASLLADRSEQAGNTLAAIEWSKKAWAVVSDDERVLRRLLIRLDAHGDRAGALREFERFRQRLAEDYETDPSPETLAVVEAIRGREAAVAEERPEKQTPPTAEAIAQDEIVTVCDGIDRDHVVQALGERYTIEREIGEGAAATVYLAHDRRYDRDVAIKVMRPELVSLVGANRFVREIEIVAQLNHPHILPLLDSAETDQLLYYVMPYVSGGSLRDRLGREGPLSIDETVRLLRAVASALDHAHAHGVIHRDIKPANILMHEGEPMVADFSIALMLDAGGERLTSKGLGLGTPEYVSPEQAVGDPVVDERTDVYSLACVIYEMLAGEPPHTGPNPQAVIARKVQEPVRSLRALRPTVPSEVEAVILKCLASVPADRCRKPGEFADAAAEAWQRSSRAEAATGTPAGGPAKRAQAICINQPPSVTPSYFQNREVETGVVEAFLWDESKRLLTVVGRGGMGKTAIVCRALERLKAGDVRRGNESLDARAVVYLNVYGSQQVMCARLLNDLSKLLEDDGAIQSWNTLQTAGATTRDKLELLLGQVGNEKTVLLVDNFEGAVHSESGAVTDSELNNALQLLLQARHHGVKLILTTRIPPRDLFLVEPARQSILHLDDGLESPYAENVLRAMDVDGAQKMHEVSQELLGVAREKTAGNPRALEALYASLVADRSTSLEEILSSGVHAMPDTVVEAFVGHAFGRLDSDAQLVMQALAAFGQPVPVAAIDGLLEPFLAASDIRPVLSRLVNTQLARKDMRGYYLHAADQEYAWAQLPPESAATDATSTSPPSQSILKQRAAQYYESVRRPTNEWRTIDDLAEPLAEFEMRVGARDYDGAARILARIGFHYLLLWGHYSLALDLYERVADKVLEPLLRQWTVGDLGTAYWRVGTYEAAIQCYNDALGIARRRNDRRGEAGLLGNLGTCFSEQGYIQRAIEHHRQAVEIQREEGDELGEATQLGNLGMTLDHLGQFDEARDCCQRALDLARKLGNRSLEAEWLGALGEIHAALGNAELALELLDEAHSVAMGIGARLVAAESLGVKGDVLRDLGQLDRAKSAFEAGMAIADEIGNPRSSWLCRAGLALVVLAADDVAGALDLLEGARELGDPLASYQVQTWFALLVARLGERKMSEKAFRRAIRVADRLLEREPRLFGALDAKGLALSGLAVVTGDRKYVEQACEVYGRARAVTAAPGVLLRTKHLLDELAKVDRKKVLKSIRRAADGKIK